MQVDDVVRHGEAHFPDIINRRDVFVVTSG